MANPRKKVDFTGIDNTRVTYKIDGVTITYEGNQVQYGTSFQGKAVTLSTHATVALAADGDAIEGRLEHVEPDGMCVVTTDGFVTLPGGASAVLTVGRAIVGALGPSSAKGYIRAAAVPGGTYAQAEVAEAFKADGEIIDASDTTAVVVDL